MFKFIFVSVILFSIWFMTKSLNYVLNSSQKFFYTFLYAEITLKFRNPINTLVRRRVHLNFTKCVWAYVYGNFALCGVWVVVLYRLLKRWYVNVWLTLKVVNVRRNICIVNINNRMNLYTACRFLFLFGCTFKYSTLTMCAHPLTCKHKHQTHLLSWLFFLHPKKDKQTRTHT